MHPYSMLKNLSYPLCTHVVPLNKAEIQYVLKKLDELQISKAVQSS